MELTQQLQQYWLPSQILGGLQHIRLYRPLQAAPKRGYPWLLLLGDTDMPTLEIVARQLHEGLQAGQLPPFAWLCIDGPKIPHCPLFLAYINRELWPWLRQHIILCDDPYAGIIAGYAQYGIAAMHIALKSPQRLRTCIAGCPDLLWSPTHDPQQAWIRYRFTSLPPIPLYLALHTTQDHFLSQNEEWQLFCSLLTQKKYTFFCQIERNFSHIHFWSDAVMSSLKVSVKALSGKVKILYS